LAVMAALLGMSMASVAVLGGYGASIAGAR
jgi:hypothetical protein